jgi:hypothetical protein
MTVAPAPLERLESANAADGPVLGALPDNTGVEYDDIGQFCI